MKTQAVGYYPVMPTVLREGGFDLMIYTNDHQPAHVHVHKAGAEAVIELDPVFLRDVIGMSRKNARKAESVVRNNQAFLLERWRAIHG